MNSLDTLFYDTEFERERLGFGLALDISQYSHSRELQVATWLVDYTDGDKRFIPHEELIINKEMAIILKPYIDKLVEE